MNMKKSPIISLLCAVLLVISLSGCLLKRAFKEPDLTKTRVVSKVKSPKMTPPPQSQDDGSGWKLVYWGQGAAIVSVRKGGTITSKFSITVYFFRELESFTCRPYRGGKASGKAVSLPPKALKVGFHKFHAWSFGGSVKLRCQESHSIPMTLKGFEAQQK